MASGSRCLARGAQALQRSQSLPPAFLLPSLYQPQSRSFQSSSVTYQRRETNKRRGLSALKGTGLRKGQTLSVKLENLPRPVSDPEKRSKIDVDPDHGLYKFFRSEDTSISPPETIKQYGRAWTVEELRKKGWEDLHRLWWACTYERNLIATEEEERRRIDAGYGQLEAEERDNEVKLTMKRIKHTLTERWYAWQNAREIAKDDPEIRLEPGLEKVYLTDEELTELDRQYDEYQDEAWNETSEEGLLEDEPARGGQSQGRIGEPASGSPPAEASEAVPADIAKQGQSEKKGVLSSLLRGRGS